MKLLVCLLLLAGGLSLTQCKKDKDEGKYGHVSVVILNDTLRADPAVGWNNSYGLDFDGVNTGVTNESDYHITAINNSSGEKKLLFYACDYNLLLRPQNNSLVARKYNKGGVVDGASDYYTAGNQCHDALVLDINSSTDFQLNSTAYLGLAYDNAGSYYNGWVKIKILNDYHSCVIVSYGVCKESNLPVKIEG